MQFLPTIALTLLALAGAAVGVVAALRGGRTSTPGRPGGDQEQGLLRVTAEIHTGWEQTLIGLIRELQLPRSAQDIAYGSLYLEASTEHRMFVRTRSEIGRGFLGAIDIVPRRGPTHLTYAIIRLPGDDQLQGRVLDFELRLIAALRQVDPGANVRLAADALRDFDRPRAGGGSAASSTAG
jgi:hypothetical protein